MITPGELTVLIEQFQNMLDWPPASKLNLIGRLNPAKTTQEEICGEKVFFCKGLCAQYHPAPFYPDNQLHDLHLKRFSVEPGNGPMKAFTLKGIKEILKPVPSPTPLFHKKQV
jgi:cytochrome c peroxidase